MPLPSRFSLAGCLVALANLASAPGAARAGCGCEKPPPAPAQLRPGATWSGTEVTLLHPALEAGRNYEVEFASGVSAASATVYGDAVLRRDVADGVARLHVAVSLPDLPLGPAAVTLRDAASGATLVALADDAFTVVPQPVAIPEGVASLSFPDYRAAVGRGGEVYLSLDLSGLHAARVFRAQLEDVPLRFGADDAFFYNVQGFLMQVLDGSIPGLSSIEAASGSDSDWLVYSRHEFATYFLQHDERAPHAVDPSDPNWHLDGTPHIDHDRQVLQLTARVDGHVPSPGATEVGTLVIETQTLFNQGLFGVKSVSISNEARVDGYRAGGSYGFGGDVRSNGRIRVKNGSRVDGDARGVSVRVSNGGRITGERVQGVAPLEMLQVDVPSGLFALGALAVTNGQSLDLPVGSYHLESLELTNGARLRVHNADGPVTLYVEGDVEITNEASVLVDDPDPERFAIYVKGDHKVKLDNEGAFYGVVYAPQSDLTLTNEGEYHGSFVGYKVKMDNGASIHFDRGLRAE